MNFFFEGNYVEKWRWNDVIISFIYEQPAFQKY